MFVQFFCPFFCPKFCPTFLSKFGGGVPPGPPLVGGIPRGCPPSWGVPPGAPPLSWGVPPGGAPPPVGGVPPGGAPPPVGGGGTPGGAPLSWGVPPGCPPVGGNPRGRPPGAPCEQTNWKDYLPVILRMRAVINCANTMYIGACYAWVAPFVTESGPETDRNHSKIELELYTVLNRIEEKLKQILRFRFWTTVTLFTSKPCTFCNRR